MALFPGVEETQVFRCRGQRKSKCYVMFFNGLIIIKTVSPGKVVRFNLNCYANILLRLDRPVQK